MDEEDWDLKEMMEVMERERAIGHPSTAAKTSTAEYEYTPHSQLAVDGCNLPGQLCLLQWTTSIGILFHGERNRTAQANPPHIRPLLCVPSAKPHQ